ncbi:MAG: ABC transporter permease [Bacteroidetes bacterium]|nr:ABC transporter permease [Bacteroidota bacterium]
MNKVGLIIKREYVTRVRKKSFIIMTILGPLLFAGIFASVFLLNRVDSEKHTIVVVDKSHLFEGKFKSDTKLTFVYQNENVDSLRAKSKDLGYFGVLFIPASDKIESLEKGVVLYSEAQPGFDIIERIKFTIEKDIKNAKMVAAGVDDKKLDMIKTDVEIQTRDLENKETSTGLTTGIGFGSGLLIYMFIFIYGAMVMRGVMEEKMSRIVEVIISSVKPFQLMLGKIVGVALVGLTQFLLWVVLSIAAVSIVSAAFLGDKTEKEKIEAMQQMRPGMNQMNQLNAAQQDQIMSPKEKLSDALASINFVVIISAFVFYFLGGYLLYSALFAAIGSAVDSETETQQFMLPVTIPLILAYVVSATVMTNPNGSVAFWFSMIPFTSPVVMMMRIPFGVPYWEVGLSMLFLIAGFIFTTWLASKIYRIGILMYGKKVSYAELWKWIRYHN